MVLNILYSQSYFYDFFYGFYFYCKGYSSLLSIMIMVIGIYKVFLDFCEIV